MSFLPPLPPSLDAALRDADASQPAHRWAAALRLREVEDDRRPEALEALRKLQADPVGPIRAAAMEALGAIGEIADRELLLRGLEDEHQEVRRAAVHALARIGEQRCWDALLEALACGPEDLREAVIIALVEHAPRGIPHAAEVIAACLLDADAAIRATAAQALGDLGSQGYRDLLAPLLEDENPEVALAAALALSDLEDPRGSATLIAALEGPFALEAALALYRSGTAEAIAPLARRMPGALGSLMLRAAIGGALHRLGDPRGEEA
ncbi:MAG: HEAT repeat domain-containing protein, partial [Myxococcales bacterium]|nr:HEAT repeat domain-containing protein [Myxococcales bacterium]